MPKYGGYSLDYAKHGLYFSSAAYCSADSIKNWDCGEACKYHPGFKPIQVYDYQLYGETNQVFTGYSDSAKKFIVAFQGTENTKQLVAEGINSIQVTASFPGGKSYKLQKYFWEAYSGLADKLKNDSKKYTDYEFFITGHSLGGVLSSICSMDFVLSGIVSSDKIMKYTYGEPRLGNSDWAKDFDKYVPNAYRIVHAADIVPHLPPPLYLAWSYEHSSQEIWYDEDFTSYTACKQNEDPDCCKSTPVAKYNIPDHLYYWNIRVGDICSN